MVLLAEPGCLGPRRVLTVDAPRDEPPTDRLELPISLIRTSLGVMAVAGVTGESPCRVLSHLLNENIMQAMQDPYRLVPPSRPRAPTQTELQWAGKRLCVFFGCFFFSIYQETAGGIQTSFASISLMAKHSQSSLLRRENSQLLLKPKICWFRSR